jgi:hypothetical protein
MGSTTLRDDAANEFEVVFDDADLITAVNGPWPAAGEEFVLDGLAAHRVPGDVPEDLRREALARGEEVCYYDDGACQVCYCDGSGRMRCVKKC